MFAMICRSASLLLFIVLLAGGSVAAAELENAEVNIVLSDAGVRVDGKEASDKDGEAVYVSNDIVFYLEGQGFAYGEGTKEDEHSQEEADAHTVVHITRPGTYRLSGTLSAGQVAVDLGKDAKKDENAVVTLVLDGVEITSRVAPAVIFYDVYECGDDDADAAIKDVDTSSAGANVIIADGSVNTLNGAYVARIYDPESVELSEDGTEVISSKKLHKYDGTLYSKRSMNVSGGEKGDGVLYINAENEGLCSDLHLTIDGGVINIVSGNDGINASEDNVSVCTVNGGEVNIVVSGTTGEGDGIDSNGWLVINGGKISASACGFSGDAGIDSDKGIYISGGEVMAGGNMLDRIAGGKQNYAVFEFASRMKGGTQIMLKNEEGQIVGQYAPSNDYMYLIAAGDEIVPGVYTLWQGDVQLSGYESGMMGKPPMDDFEGERPEGSEWPKMMPHNGDDSGRMTPPEIPEGLEGFDPDGMMPPEGMGDMEGTQMPKVFEQDEFGGRRGFGGRGSRGEQGESSVQFVIKEGGTVFSGISASQE